MKNILVFTSTFPKCIDWDSTPPFVYELSRRLAAKWLNITILTPRVPGALSYEERDGMKILRYPYFFSEELEHLNDGAILANLRANPLLYFQVPFFIISGFYHLIKTIRSEKIDVIHAHWIIPQWFLALLYKRFFDKKMQVTCTTHGGDIFWLRWPLGTLIKKYTLKHTDSLTVVSSAIKDECIKLWVHKKRIQVIPMWVDTALFHPKKYDRNIIKEYQIEWKLILFVGRLAEKKWVNHLIDAMEWVVSKYPDTKLLIIWHGPLEAVLKKQTKKLHLDANIIFVGAIENSELPRYYATADIFVWPSIEASNGDSEGFGLVFVEAILSWCITLGSDLHGITDIIEHGKTGYFIEQKNPKDIEQKILKILDGVEYDTVKAREIIEEKFSWDILSEKYIQLLSK